jgi:hypothetical protein
VTALASVGAAAWNAVRFDPGTRAGHVESYFFKANEPSGDRAIWVRATISSTTAEPDRPVAEGWAIAFDRRGGVAKHVAVKHVIPYGAASFGDDRLAVRWQDRPSSGEGVSMDAEATRGVVRAKGHEVRWNLGYRGELRPLVPFPTMAMYTGPFPRSKLCTPVPDARFEGEVVVDGERWAVDGWRGMQGHNWGRGHAELYAWCHGNVWKEEPELVLEGMSGRVRVGPVLSPMTTLVCVRYRGVVYDFNAPLTLLRAHGDISPRGWTFSAEGKLGRIEGVVEAGAEDMVGLHYPNPDGAMTYCLNTKLASASVRFEPAGRPPITLTSNATALEIGTRNADHGVRMHV